MGEIKSPAGRDCDDPGVRRIAGTTRRAGCRPLAAAALIALLLAAGCGFGSDSDGEEGGGAAPAASVPGGGDPDDVRVIDAWADALRAGDVEKAASYFEVPSTAQNGTPPLHLTSRADVLDFNKSLPCGAKLTRASSEGHFTTATFELTDRPGGGCGPGAGGTARTAFVIEEGHIVEWTRVGDQPPSQGDLI
jgi:hypothetical protein